MEAISKTTPAWNLSSLTTPEWNKVHPSSSIQAWFKSPWVRCSEPDSNQYLSTLSTNLSSFPAKQVAFHGHGIYPQLQTKTHYPEPIWSLLQAVIPQYGKPLFRLSPAWSHGWRLVTGHSLMSHFSRPGSSVEPWYCYWSMGLHVTCCPLPKTNVPCKIPGYIGPRIICIWNSFNTIRMWLKEGPSMILLCFNTHTHTYRIG